MAVVYLERDGQQFGPFSIEEAQRYILEGRFGGQDLGWIDGMQEWLSVAQIPELQTANSTLAARPLNPSTPYAAAPSMPPAPSAAYAPYSAPSYPGLQNSGLQNPGLQNPGLQNPGMQSLSPQNLNPQNQGFAAAKDFSRSEYAGFWRRAAALMIDSFIVMIVAYFLTFVLMLIFGLGLGVTGMTRLGANTATPNAIAIATVVLPAFLSICYFALWNASANMATPGKMAAGLVVVNAQAQRISVAQSFLREFVKLIGSWFFCLTFATQPISARRQAIHDFASATVVLRQRPDAGMPSILVWLINLCWVAAVFIMIAIVIAFQR